MSIATVMFSGFILITVFCIGIIIGAALVSITAGKIKEAQDD